MVYTKTWYGEEDFPFVCTRSYRYIISTHAQCTIQMWGISTIWDLMRAVAAMDSYCCDATRCQTVRLNLSFKPWLWLGMVVVI